MRIVVVIAAIIFCVLGYGYWHSSTHASYHVYLSVKDKAGKEVNVMSGARVKFLDGEGQVLAEGKSDSQYSYVHLLHPEFGDCHDVEKTAAFSGPAGTTWQDCFESQSTWITGWVAEVRQVEVLYKNCVFRNIPVTASGPGSGWYLWWVPHPHIGGTPYSYYSTYIRLEENQCTQESESEVLTL